MTLISTVTALMAGKFFMFSDVASIALLSISNTFCYIIIVVLNFKISGAKVKNTVREMKKILSKLIKK